MIIRMHMFRAAFAAALLLAFGHAAIADEAGAGKFLRQAIRGDLSEVQIGKLAQQKSTNAEVKSFGEMLVTDHGAHLTEASTLAKTMNVKVHETPTQKAQAIYNKLAKLSGAAFDKEFVAAMVKDHQEDIAKYQQEAQANDGEVSALAQKTLPVLQHHLETAQALQPKVNAEQQSSE